MRPRPDAHVAAVAIAAALVFLAGAGSRGDAWQGRYEVTDVPLYATYGNRLEDGRLPYRDFRFEYPPGALPVLALPALVAGGERGYARAFAALMTLCGMAAIALTALALDRLRAGPGRAALALAPLALSPLLLGSLVLTRFDLLPAALTAGVLAAALAGRLRLAALVLGIAVGVKLYPLVLLPALAAWAWRRAGRAEGLRTVLLTSVTVVLVYVPFALLSPGGVAWSLGRQLSRPLQIESLGAGVLLALHDAAGLPLGWASSHGSQNLTGGTAVVAVVLLTVAQLTVLGWTWARFARGPAEPERLVRYTAASVVAFVALGKVLSPQFLIWLLPLAPLAAGARGAAAALLLGGACLATRGWFPGRYWELVKEFDPLASWLVLGRDLLLVALLLVLAWPAAATARRRGPARSPAPARSPGRT